jgi:6-phosphogluconolactonase
MPRLQVVPSANAAAIRGAQVLADLLRRSIYARGSATFAISGGSTPWPMFERLLKDQTVDWTKVYLFQVDERVAPDGDPERNWTKVQDLFIDNGPVLADQAFAMPVTATDLYAACGAYQARIRALRPDGRIDVVQLGLGDDGHTASLVPGDPVCDIADADVATTSTMYKGHRRMTFTRGALNRSGTIVWFVLGDAKTTALRKLLDGDLSIPAGRLDPADAIAIADTNAWGEY